MTLSLLDPNVARVLTHPLRLEILRTIDTGRASSPIAIAQLLGEPLGNVAYHVRELQRRGFVRLVGTAPRRGALEHFYELTDTARRFFAAVAALSEASDG